SSPCLSRTLTPREIFAAQHQRLWISVVLRTTPSPPLHCREAASLLSTYGRTSLSLRYATSSLVFSLLVENFSTKGNFRRATSTFVDLSGTAYNPQSSTALPGGGISPEHLWAHKSLTALCDVITMLSAANQQQIQATGHPLSVPMTDVPHRHNRLIQLLREFLGGNCKTTMLCCVNTRINTVDEILSALSYAYYFKSIKNFPIPYDIPPELQRLNLQMNRYAEED
ncbi:kinesin-like protein, putative, partial [Bodo saltans]